MIEMRRAQLSFGGGLIADEVDDLCEEWMKHADQVLTDDQIVTAVYEALAKRHPKSRSRGRLGAPAEVVLRLLLLKHVRNWSYQVLEREVRANLVYRDFTRVGAGKTPDAKTMGRWGVALGPEAIKQIHERIVQIAQGNGLVQGRRMRVDTTVVETNIHYPTGAPSDHRKFRAPSAERETLRTNTYPIAAGGVSMLVPSGIHAKYPIPRNAKSLRNPRFSRAFTSKITHSIPRRPYLPSPHSQGRQGRTVVNFVSRGVTAGLVTNRATG